MKNAKRCIFIILTVIAVMILATACDDKGGDIHNNEPPEIIKTVITFDTDGGNSINRIEVTDMSLFSLPSNPTKTGYTFINWFMDADFETVATAENLSTITIGQNITLYAKWQINTYTVNFYDGETLLKTETVNYGESATPPTVTKEGHTFLGWDKEYSLVKENLNIYAKWGTNTYTVSFYDGETLLKTETVNYGESATAPTVTKEGFFITWSKEFSHVKEDLQVQAVFTIKHIKVTVYVDNEIYDEIYTTIEKDYKIEEPMKPEYNNTGNSNSDKYFHGWFTDENYTMSFNNDFQFLNDSAIYGKTIDVGSAIYNYSIAYDKVTITQFLDDSAKFAVIPSFINGFPVVAVGASAFANKTMLRTVIIGEGIQVIGNSTFNNCNGLTNITIPNSVTSIGYYAFYGCSGLKAVHIPNLAAWCGISFDDYYANPLSYANNLYLNGVLVTELIIPDGVTSIGGYAFSGCTGLTSITIPDSVKSIGGYAFYGCTGLTSITIPDSVTSIGASAFSGCSGLTAVHITNLTAWCGISFDDYYANPLSYAHNLYLNGVLVTELIIPDGVTSIGGYAFSGCTGLTSITIPDSVKSIGGYAFYGCTGLTSITIPDSVTSIGYSAFRNCTGLTSITIPDSVTSIGYSAFSGCTGLTSITIPDSVKNIGYYAFSGCSGLTAVHITNLTAWCGISFDDYYANPLSYANNLYLNGELVTELIIPDGVTSIGAYAFYGCTGLTSITISDSVKSIGDSAFYGCSGLTAVHITNLAAWCGISFYDDHTYPFYYYANPLYYAHNLYLNGELVTELIIPDGVTSIGGYAFSDCTGLTSITISDSVKSIGDSAFYGCSGLTAVHITNFAAWCGISFYNYDANPLSYAHNLYLNEVLVTELIIPDGVTSIGDRAFSGCTGLTSITIPNSVTSIGRSAFYGCTGLTSITIPDSVTSIGAYAFSGCTGLTSITIPDSVTSIGDSAFYGCSKIISIYCEVNSKPYNWDENWNRRDNSSGAIIPYNVVWGWSGNKNS